MTEVLVDAGQSLTRQKCRGKTKTQRQGLLGACCRAQWPLTAPLQTSSTWAVSRPSGSSGQSSLGPLDLFPHHLFLMKHLGFSH